MATISIQSQGDNNFLFGGEAIAPVPYLSSGTITPGALSITYPYAPPSISSISMSNIPTQPLLIIYYNTAQNGYLAYVLSNQTNAQFFLNTPNVYENILPNNTFYNVLPSALSSDLIISEAEANGLTASQAQLLAQTMGQQYDSEMANYVYSGMIYYSNPNANLLDLECHFITSDACSNNPPDGELTIQNFTDYISSIATPYNATLLYYNSTASKSFESFGISVLNGLSTISFFIPDAIWNGFMNLISNGNAGNPAIAPQIPLPMYTETMTSTQQAINVMETTYSPSQTLTVQFNYENNMLPTTNMEKSIYEFNTYVDGNIANQSFNDFLNNSLLEIFVIGIICYIVLKFNGS
ncbi:MAG: hypothetical protein QXH07_01205 [Thermoplasmata archaeon]